VDEFDRDPLMTKRLVAGPGWLRAAGELALGIVLALVPLALWVAWSPDMLLFVIAAGGVSAALLIVLWGPSESGRIEEGQPRTVVSDQFVEEVHRLFPLTYHHSRRGKLRFRRAMEKLRRMVW